MTKEEIQGRLICLLLIIINTDENDPTPGFKNGLFQSEEDRKDDLNELAKKYLFGEDFPSSRAWIFFPGEAINRTIPPSDIVIKSCYDDGLWEICWQGECVDSIMWENLQDKIANQNLSEEDRLLIDEIDKYLKAIKFQF